MPNRLANETSPYLLQHKDNPVEWFPWGNEALTKSQDEDKPIFLSIGYSACHWCHVMEHESFESDTIAKFLNENFVSIKVDREERPDLDQVYMNAVQMLTGRGGWPMSVFLTPDLKPFYGGTYWPPTAGRGMPGFDQVLTAVDDTWRHRREQALAGAEDLATRIQSLSLPDPSDQALDEALLLAAAQRLERDFDPRHGGFGEAPKFPQAMNLQALLRVWSRTGRQQWLEMVTLTLDKMHSGGMYDHLGGGFARYSVDDRWLTPHFEKMLYDNASLAMAYTEGYLATGDPNYATIVRETLDYVLRDMTDPAGGFYSAEDADSEGEEGKFYVWSPEEVRKVLGDEEAELFCRVYDVTPLGNFEGKSILNLPKTIAQLAGPLGYEESELSQLLADARTKLLAARNQRVRPGRDDKVLTNWNGLMIDALARAGAALADQRYIAASQRAADFVLKELAPSPGRLLHTWCAGQAKQPAFLDDYGALAGALISLYEATFDEHYLQSAKGLLDTILEHFLDAERGIFFYTADDHEQLISRTVELADNATPSGASLATTALLRLGTLAGQTRYLDAAHQALAASGSMIERVPIAMGQMLLALDLWVGPTHELVFTGQPGGEDLAQTVHRRFLPRRVLAYRANPNSMDSLLNPTFAGKSASNNELSLFVCQSGACSEPARGETEILAKLDSLANR